MSVLPIEDQDELGKRESACIRALQKGDVGEVEKYIEAGVLDPETMPKEWIEFALHAQGLPVLKLMQEKGFDVLIDEESSAIKNALGSGLTDIVLWYAEQGHRLPFLSAHDHWWRWSVCGVLVTPPSPTRDQDIQAFWNAALKVYPKHKSCTFEKSLKAASKVYYKNGYWAGMRPLFQLALSKNPKDPMWNWVVPSAVRTLMFEQDEREKQQVIDFLNEYGHLLPWPKNNPEGLWKELPSALQESLGALWEREQIREQSVPQANPSSPPSSIPQKRRI